MSGNNCGKLCAVLTNLLMDSEERRKWNVSYKYRLTKDSRGKEEIRYTLEELKNMGTFRLRDICVQEKIMTRQAGIDPQRLKREDLIDLLYRYRGRKEETLLDGFPEESVQLLKELAKGASLAAAELKIPQKLEIIKDIPLMEDQEILISHGFSGRNFLGLITDQEGEILAVLEVKNRFLTLSPKRTAPDLSVGIHKDLWFLLFNAASSLEASQVYSRQRCDLSGSRGLTAAKARLPILTVAEAEEAKEPLVIDFGAGCTSAAAAGQDGILSVLFPGGSLVCPTAAAVERCNGQEVSFRFGYDALSLIKHNGYGSSMTFLHNLKLYLFEEKKLELWDQDGNGGCISSDLVLREFFAYIISLAKAEHKRYYTRLCFLLPEKRGQLALQRLKEILPDYQVESGQSESVNSVYQKIVEQIEYEPGGGPERVLAFHCGAGSSSLTACQYHTENTNVAYRVKMEQQYLSGDSGFGGNNLTCLIFKYLKIKILWELKGRTEPILDEMFSEAYTFVDEYGGTKEIYERFHGLYEEAEQMIPTKFGKLEETMMVKKQNFYRLWFLAEGLKEVFFSEEPISVVRLPERFRELCGVNVIDPDGIREFKLDFPVDKAELELVLAPEIYRIVKSFIEPLCEESGILTGYKIKFTGLSCKIPVFRDALREFTVGRRARRGSAGLLDLKLKAMEGAICREQLIKSGKIVPEIRTKPDEISYTVTVKTHDNATLEIVSKSREEGRVFGCIRRHMATKTVEFSICDLSGNLVRKRELFLDISRFSKTGYDLLFEAYPFLGEIQGEIDSIEEEEIRIFVFREENWDFCALPVARKEGGLWADQVKRFLFDDEGADYFNGTY